VFGGPIICVIRAAKAGHSGAEFFLDRLANFFHARRRLEPGSGQEATSRQLPFPVFSLQSQGQPNREKKGIHHMSHVIQSKDFTTFMVSAAALVCFGLAPMVQAAGPDTDGAIGGQNNGEGIGVLVNRTTGVWNTGTGYQALNHTTSGNQNTAEGYQALFNTSTGKQNTASGALSLFSNTAGNFNTAMGFQALSSNTADGNSAFGHRALASNTGGTNNTAVGFQAARHNTDGSSNTAIGYQALHFNTTGYYNTANGDSALVSNTTGYENVANGVNGLYSNTTGFYNTANGVAALANNTAGEGNTANGLAALINNTTGNFNTADGYQALAINTTGGGNTAIGPNALFFHTAGNYNIALGAGAGNSVTTADSVIAIGSPGGNDSNSCYIGQIFGVTSSGGTAVFINSDGKLGTTTSSRRFKEGIKPMERASEALFALKPVTFRYKKGIDPRGIPQFGLVAEDVETVNPDLVVRDKEGKVNTVRYEAVNAMLLNEFLKEHRKVEEQEGTITQLKKEMETVVARLKEHDSKIQRVSNQLELSKPAPQVVVSDP
jgi:hypothetical protein